MEHIFFEAQLCSEISVFKEKSNFGYTDHPEKPALIGQSAACCEHTFRLPCTPPTYAPK